MSKESLVEIIGWLGAIATVASFGLTVTNVISGDGLLYQLLNLGGAAGILVIAAYKRVYQLVLVGLLALAIAIVVLFKLPLF